MPIDIATEKVVSPKEAIPYVPRRRKGKRPALATIYRWMEPGVRGVKLEYLQVGNCRCTSVEALQRFFDRLTRGPDPEAQPAPSSSRQERAAAAAERGGEGISP